MTSMTRAISMLVVALAVFMGITPARLQANRCYIQVIYYYDDSNCGNNLVGEFATDCNGQPVYSWGYQTGHFISDVDGGDDLCGCGGEYWHDVSSYGCS